MLTWVANLKTAILRTASFSRYNDEDADAKNVDLSAAFDELDDVATAAISPGDHGALAGLADVGDHPGYLLVDGSRALTGDQDAGGNKVTNLAAPVGGTDAARLDDVEAAIVSLEAYADAGDTVVAAAAILKSLLTTKGDVIAATAASTPARVAVGADYKALISLAAASPGVAWGVPQGSNIALFVGTGTFDLRWCGLIGSAVPGTLLPSIDIMAAYPFFVPLTMSIDRITFEVTTVSGASGKARVGIYSSTSPTNPTPDALIVDGGEFDVSAVGGTGAKNATVAAQMIGPGIYWMAFLSGTAAPTVRSATANSILPLLGAGASFGANMNLGVTRAQAYGALPNPFGGSLALRTVAMPLVGVRISSVP